MHVEPSRQHPPASDPLSGEGFILNLCDSGLFAREDVDEALAQSAGVPAVAELAGTEGEVLAQRLVSAGKLTDYQARAVLEGKFADLVIGNYEVLDRLGAGGMGTVFKARHRRMKRIVALKVLASAASQSETFQKRFQREVEVIAQLAHPNIVMAFDAGEATIGHFLVMEFVNGRDLATEVRDRGPLPIPEAVATLLQAARALEYAHGQGIVHRDIKPANLLRDVSGVIKVADLGLARFHDASSESKSLTQSGVVVGTVDYMAPEQAVDSSTIDARADIYSLGCTLYFLLTGTPPFRGESFMSILMKHQNGAIPDLAAARKDVPAGLAEVFRKMLAKDVEDRFQSMAQVIEALEHVEKALAQQGARAPGSADIAGSPTVGSKTVVASPPTMDTGATIDLPLAKAVACGVKPVLVVEPSRVQAGIIRRLLQELGTTDVLAAPSAQKALEIIRGTSLRAVIAAMHLTDTTGIKLAEQLRGDAKLADLGFILVSSEADAPEAAALARLPRTVMLPKPFDLEKLAQALRQVSAQQASEAEPGVVVN